MRSLKENNHSGHSHKKLKDSLETWAELDALRTYTENQAILEPILLYRRSKGRIKMKTNQRAGQQGLFMDPYFYLFIRLLSAFFFCQDAEKARSSRVIIGYNLSNQHCIKHRAESQTT